KRTENDTSRDCGWKSNYREDRNCNLDNEPSNDRVARRETVNSAPAQFGKEAVETCRTERISQEAPAFLCLLLDTRGEDRLKVRTLLFTRDHRNFDVVEAGFFQPLMQLHFAKSKPVISI